MAEINFNQVYDGVTLALHRAFPKAHIHGGVIKQDLKDGNQYCGSSLCDVAFIQLMLEIKYATLGLAQVMTGCRSYSTTYTAAAAETGVRGSYPLW